MLREVFRVVKHMEDPSALFEVEETSAAEGDNDEMNGFLDRFDLEKKYVVVVISAGSIAQRMWFGSPETGSILNFEIPEITFETTPAPSEHPSPSQSVHIDVEETMEEQEEEEAPKEEEESLTPPDVPDAELEGAVGGDEAITVDEEIASVTSETPRTPLS